MDTSLWQDESQLANMLLEEESNRSSSESSSPGFHFNSAVNLKKNLTATFDKELSKMPVIDRVDHFESNKAAATSCAIRSVGQLPSTRPPLPTGTVLAKPRSSSKRVAVFLRIRPLSPSSSSSKRDGNSSTKDKGTSTIEVLKPLSNSKSQTTFPTTIRTYPPALSNAYKMNINRQSRDNSAYTKEFHFDRVMGPDTSQQNVYLAVAAPMIQDLFDASDRSSSSSKIRRESALLFSYGITNAGKTHTVLGEINSTNQANWGIIPRAISDVFQRNRIHSVPDSTSARSNPSSNDCKKQPCCDLYISFFEIYNENVYDLMPSNKSVSSKDVNSSLPALKVRECRGQIFVRGLAKHKVKTLEHGIELTKQAHNKRHTSSNNLNSDSSRSHFVCQMQIVPLTQPIASFPVREFVAEAKVDGKFSSADTMSGYSTDEEAMARSRLPSSSTIWIVDLAGSERSKRTRVGSTRQKESTKINNSLMTLMRCLNAMKDKGKQGNSASVIPFRESKLTHIFMGHLTSKSAARTAMMVNVNPSVEDFDETQHVLAYSRKAKLIEMNIEEYGMKRKQIFGEEYDHNGRKKARHAEKKHPPTDVVAKKSKKNILSRMAKKLSPKKTLKKNPANAKNEKDNILSSANGDHDEEIERLKKSLQVIKDCVHTLENENMQLLDELGSKEDKIRTEVAIEMEERLRETRTKHKLKYEHLRSVMHHQTSKTDISVSMNRAGNQLEELMDKIDECEKEMFRMSQEHRQKVTALNNEIEELNRRDNFAVNEKAKNASKISSLEQALKKSNEEIMRLRQQKRVQEIASTDRAKKSYSKDINDDIGARPRSPANKSSKFQRNLRPRKPLGTSTNQNLGSHVFPMNTE